jgi:hypothetical protein
VWLNVGENIHFSFQITIPVVTTENAAHFSYSYLFQMTLLVVWMKKHAEKVVLGEEM